MPVSYLNLLVVAVATGVAVLQVAQVYWKAQPRTEALLEELWALHLAFEFDPAQKSTPNTMATMVASPAVTHVPTLIGGAGKANLADFYQQHFIFSNPPMDLTPIKRTIPVDGDFGSLVDEMVVEANHTTPIDWLLPNVPPTGRTILFPLVASVDFRRAPENEVEGLDLARFDGWRLHRERIYWDQASVLKQIGLLDTDNALPVTGAEQARPLLDGDETIQANQLLDKKTAASSTE